MASEVVERSRSHFLTRDEDGWALWGVDQDADDALLTFPPDTAGEERARSAFEVRSRETARVRWLAIAAVIAAAAWLLIEVVGFVLERTRAVPSEGFLGRIDTFTGPPSDLEIILEGIGQVAETAFIVATGWFLVAWLQRRWRREG